MTMAAESHQAPLSAVKAMLERMDDTDLQQFISEHLGPQEPKEIWNALLHNDIAARTFDALSNLIVNLNGQAGVRKAALKTLEISDADDEAYLSAKGDYDEWKRRANHYRTLVDGRLRQARAAANRARREAHLRNMEVNHDQHRQVAAKLSIAIHQHREASRDADIKPEPHDVKLWSLLEELQVRCGGDLVSLSEAITYGFWYAREDE